MRSSSSFEIQSSNLRLPKSKNIQGFDNAQCGSALRVACELQVEGLKPVLIERLEVVVSGITQKISLAQRYNQTSWLKSLYERMIIREASLSVQDAKKIGLLDAVKLCIIRDTKTDNDTTLYHSRTGYICPAARARPSLLVSGASESESKISKMDDIMKIVKRWEKNFIDLICKVIISLNYDSSSYK